MKLKPVFAFLLTFGLLANASAPSVLPQTSATAAPKLELKIDDIMRGAELVGYEPRAVRWSADSQKIYFQWKQASEPRDKEFDTYVAHRDGAGLKKLTGEEARTEAPPTGGETSRDRKLTVFEDRGDIVLYDHTSGRARRITNTTDIESNPHFTHDQKRIYFTRSNNLFVMPLDSSALVQVTDVRSGVVPPQPRPPQAGPPQSARESSQRGTDSQEYLKKEERELLQTVKERAKKREEDEERRKRENPRKPFNLQGRQIITSFQLSPDEKHVIAMINEPGDATRNTIVPNYITEAAYTEDISSRTKVGEPQSRTRIAIIDSVNGEFKWGDHGQKRLQQPKESQAKNPPPTGQGDPEKTAARIESSRSAESPRDNRSERDVQLFPPLWSKDGTKAVMLARSADNKDKWIFALDPATGKTREIVSDHDDAWIGGPGAFTLGWMKDDKQIYFQSERDGHTHLYTLPYEGGQSKQLTSGKWEVTGVRLSDDKSRFFLTTSEAHPGERHLYVMPADGGERTKVTSNAGNNQALVSPDEKMIATINSYSNRPPELFVQEIKPGAAAIKITSSPSPKFWSYKWSEPELATFAARDGASVYVRLYKPKGFKQGGPAVVFVHGAGYLQNAHRWWSSYYHEYMFHHLLMEHGYVVADVDYRGSAGYGRDWRTGIYRHMGGKDLDDQVDAARWLVREHGVDAKRIGIYGGSYGGFITLMAMFTQPDVFAAGAALRPVTDWAHYNHQYTSNILNVPQEDNEAYHRSSPIYFAQGLKGALLICHGMVDTNVHFQDTVRLVQRLIELRKENWELAAYPVENHGFVEPTSWADEYKRIFKLFEENLRLPSKAPRANR